MEIYKRVPTCKVTDGLLEAPSPCLYGVGAFFSLTFIPLSVSQRH